MKLAAWIPLALSVAVTAAAADDPCATPKPTPPLTGSIGAGLAHTSGNTDTTTINATVALQWDPKTGNVVKASGLYLRGRTNGTDTVDQTSAAVRDEYHLGARSFVFVDVQYLRDQFKQVTYLVAPVVGFGYQVVKTDQTHLALEAAVGGAFEKDESTPATSSGAYRAAETFSHKLSPTATIAEGASAVWKTRDSSDALYHLEVSLAAAVTHHSELKVSFLDDIKNRPASPELAKSDTAIVMAFVMKL